jgi:hypothetical protein
VGELGRAEAVGQDVRNHERGVDPRQCTRVDERADELDEARFNFLMFWARVMDRSYPAASADFLRWIHAITIVYNLTN